MCVSRNLCRCCTVPPPRAFLMRETSARARPTPRRGPPVAMTTGGVVASRARDVHAAEPRARGPPLAGRTRSFRTTVLL